MPTPVVLQSGEIKAYENKQADKDSNVVSIFYATNRFPLGLKNDRIYTTGVTDTLHLGQADVRIGEKGKPWDFLKAFSTTEERDQKLKLVLEKTDELVKLEDGQDIKTAAEQTRAFIVAVNRALRENESKDITIYVHGATANFYVAAAQAAQIRHFTGYSHVVLAFSWPTAESFLHYGTDVQNALETAPLFARLLQLLAQNTDVEQINVLAYSAGGQVASPGLSLLGKNSSALPADSARKNHKLGEVYFAAPDVEMKSYVEQLPDYLDLVDSTTIALNPDDFVLRISSFHQGTPRIGRPVDNVLTEQEGQWLTDASNNGSLNVIKILPEILGNHRSGAHDFWYSHPWVSTDVLVQLLFHTPPVERGLDDDYTEGFRWWYYPEDYPENIIEIVKELDKDDRVQP